MNAVVAEAHPPAIIPPRIGQAWPEHGGIYIGSRLADGVIRHLVVPGGVEHDKVGVSHSAALEISEAEINGHRDWVLPDQRDLMLAYINVPELFDTGGFYWSATQYGSFDAWAVDFENGTVYHWYRNDEFRARAVRVINSPL